ncbi:hypothetical protein [Nocardioides aequoreus]|uniref:hypothetical protein n=1 Tax=Nocardioides aequoreus TaxID=397278 RepID=UPI0012F654AB|nr:hypothetical protein [Nocardioides aequoreus]
MAAVAVWAAPRLGSPTLLGEDSGLGFEAAPRPVSQAAGFAGLAIPGSEVKDEALTFRGVPSVRFETNTAAASARVAVCVRADNQVPVGSAYLRDLDESCAQVRDVEEGTRLRWDADVREDLILIIIPTRPGVARVDQVTYDYRIEGGPGGTDVGAVEYTIRAT